jgi:hypothetical protein
MRFALPGAARRRSRIGDDRGHSTGDVVAASNPVRLTGRVDSDLIAVSDRAVLGQRARVRSDLRYGDERPVLAPGARVGGTASDEDWADGASGWGCVSGLAWWLAGRCRS